MTTIPVAQADKVLVAVTKVVMVVEIDTNSILITLKIPRATGGFFDEFFNPAHPPRRVPPPLTRRANKEITGKLQKKAGKQSVVGRKFILK